MAEAYDKIKRSLESAIAFAEGHGEANVYEIDISQPDVRVIRVRTGLSQAAFARSIGIKKSTLLNWEHRRRKPQGPARVLLAMIDRDPGIVQRTLAPSEAAGAKSRNSI